MPKFQETTLPPSPQRHDPDDRYCTKQVVVQLFVLGLLLLAVALGAFLASVRFCRLGFENSCYYGYVTASNIGVAAVSAGACGGAVTKRTAVYITCTAIPLLLYSVVVLSIALADDCCDYGYDNVAGNFTVPERETAGALFFSGYATLSLGVMFLVTGSVFLCLVSKQNKSSLNIDSTREQEAYPRQLGLQHTQPGGYIRNILNLGYIHNILGQMYPHNMLNQGYIHNIPSQMYPHSILNRGYIRNIPKVNIRNILNLG
ncbi:hypothetical protein C7M84_009128 [Penaeus vannamei]|uniref:Transmembrane protein n=1 Tax=Penaeus vannamei TaxID=6689 RepID=A0A423T7Q1_PENVA|nr:hypothetical protein C7M84_009128 [Penaeus vannamei]